MNINEPVLYIAKSIKEVILDKKLQSSYCQVNVMATWNLSWCYFHSDH